MSALIRWAGVGEVPAGLGPEQERELLAVLIAAAEHARWCGVVPDWDDASEIERVAWATAGRRIALQQARWIGLAAQGPRAAAGVAAELDGGEEHDQILLAEGLLAAAAVIRGGRP
jgi:hypothetical protein